MSLRHYKDAEKARAYRNRHKAANYAKSPGDPHVSGSRWQPWEDRAVLAHSVTDAELSRRIGRSKRAIQVRRAALKKEANMAMGDYEPASGFNLPPGVFDEDIDREFGGERRYCADCAHLIESDALDCRVCDLKLRDAIASLRGSQRWLPECILAAVEDAVADEGDCCADFEE